MPVYHRFCHGAVCAGGTILDVWVTGVPFLPLGELAATGAVDDASPAPSLLFEHPASVIVTAASTNKDTFNVFLFKDDPSILRETFR